MSTDEDKKKSGGGGGNKNMSPGERKARFGNQKPQRPPQRKEREKENDDRMGKKPRKYRDDNRMGKKPRPFRDSLEKNRIGSELYEVPSKNITSNNPNESFKKEKRDSEAPPSIKNKKPPTGTVNPNEIKRTIKEKFASSLVGKALKKKKEIQKKVGEKVLGVLGLEISKKSRGGLMRKPKLAKRGF